MYTQAALIGMKYHIGWRKAGLPGRLAAAAEAGRPPQCGRVERERELRRQSLA